MRITVLGKSPAWQDAGGACSGFLVEHQSTSVLLECGSGVFGKLRKFRDYTTVDAVIISHMHSDHFFDLVPFAFALLYSPRQQPVAVDRWPGTSHPARPLLHLPVGGVDILRRVVGAFGDERLIEQAFSVNEYTENDTLAIQELGASFCPVPHYTPAFAVELKADDGKRFTYGSDCRPNEQLIAFATETDILMVEGTLPRAERSGERGHLTPYEAGQHAALARARQLVLTHTSDELDELWTLSELERAFGGPAVVAHEGAVFTP